MCKIICGFPGIGKTTFYENNKHKLKIKDLDYCLYPLYSSSEDKINFIKQNYSNYDYILVSCRHDLICGLNIKNIEYLLVIPDHAIKTEYIKRYSERGSHKDFINDLYNNFKLYIDLAVENSKSKTIILKSGQYLEDVLLN